MGKIDNGIVAVTTLWAHELRYYPLHVMPYTPESRRADGKQDPSFQTKPQIAVALVEHAQAVGIPFKAIVADCFYGDNHALEAVFRERHLPYVLAHRGTVGRGWAPADAAHSFDDAARDLTMRDWHRVARRFRDGHTQRWWAVELTLFNLWPQQAGARYLRHHRPPYLARAVDLVFNDEPACYTGPVGRSGALVRIAQLDRAKLQANEGCARLG